MILSLFGCILPQIACSGISKTFIHCYHMRVIEILKLFITILSLYRFIMNICKIKLSNHTSVYDF